MLLILGGTLAVYDYMRVVVIFAPPVGAALARAAHRRRAGRASLFGHHADYAAATIAEHPGTVMSAFERAPHYLLDARLMIAWAKALDGAGETDGRATWRRDCREFRNEQVGGVLRRVPAAEAAASEPVPFQCEPPTRTFRLDDFS